MSGKMTGYFKSQKRKKPSGKSSGQKRFRTSSVAMVPALNRQSQGELNFVDIPLTGIPFDTTATRVQLLNGLVPGTSENQRLGRKVTMKSVLVRASVQFLQQGASPIATDYLRYLLVYDRQSNGVAPVWADVIQSTTAASANSSSSWDSKNESNRDRFAILRDKKWRINQVNTGTINAGVPLATELSQYTGTDPVTFTDYVKLKGLETHYNTGTAGTIADITTGGLFVMVQGFAAAANANYELVMTSRVNFIA